MCLLRFIFSSDFDTRQLLLRACVSEDLQSSRNHAGAADRGVEQGLFEGLQIYLGFQIPCALSINFIRGPPYCT